MNKECAQMHRSIIKLLHHETLRSERERTVDKCLIILVVHG